VKKKLSSKQEDHIRQLYNHANVLHDVAWEAKRAYEEAVGKMVRKCKSKEEFDALFYEVDSLLHCVPLPLPPNPKPKRPTGHSGNLDIFSFWDWYFATEKGWSK
jgi:hypothetical protein